ncbi:hypothetical protein [Cerasicoccus arenae]|uniref:Uncharacterized protein n=1 Tax=Cerasicoccus arenae TaxID=424488 RepID=A0A8J3GEE4_9BACT|nr:hypothetical protein [Cerasicoccus arenae]MBK1859889.1 hypothetical protein [Cerasicoccus arenae]GHC08702.1 hypothetical protein GCM10007047_27380 [Cerasicoccus arenae]
MNDALLEKIRALHIEIERQLQHIGQVNAQPHCAVCTSVCCKESFCRESVDSAFLRFILGQRADEYDDATGWFTPGQGCQLDHGRPLVCYEYFCNKFSTAELSQSHASIARELRAIYANAHQGQHMLIIDDLSVITQPRLQRIADALQALRDRLANSPGQAAVEQSR